MCARRRRCVTDMYQTGVRGAAALRRILAGAEPVTAFVRIPLVVPPEKANTQATPAQVQAGACSSCPPAMLAQVQHLEAQPWCLSAGVSLTQPWLRVDDFGSSVVVTAAHGGARAKAAAAAERLAASLWELRESFLPRMGLPDSGGTLVPHPAAVAAAAEHARVPGAGLVVIGDGSTSVTYISMATEILN
jgi:microcystin degradation protein MlrC